MEKVTIDDDCFQAFGPWLAWTNSAAMRSHRLQFYLYSTCNMCVIGALPSAPSTRSLFVRPTSPHAISCGLMPHDLVSQFELRFTYDAIYVALSGQICRMSICRTLPCRSTAHRTKENYVPNMEDLRSPTMYARHLFRICPGISSTRPTKRQ